MKSSFFKIGLVLALITVAPIVSHGASGTTDSGGIMVATPINSTLLLDTITVQDDMHVFVSFNQSVVPEAVRVRITKQSDGSNTKVDKITGVVNTPESVLVALTDTLEEGATYTLTVVSAISESGVVIKEGSDALKEFTTPVPLKRSMVVFNAPSNPNAVVTTGATTATGTPVITVAPAVSSGQTNTGTKSTTPAKVIKELPITGMDPLLFLLVAGGLAFLFLLRRKA